MNGSTNSKVIKLRNLFLRKKNVITTLSQNKKYILKMSFTLEIKTNIIISLEV